MCDKVGTWLSGRYVIGDNDYYTQKMNDKFPGFLMEGEEIKIVFKMLYNKIMLTNKRVFKKTGKKRVDLETISFDSVGAMEINCKDLNMESARGTVKLYTCIAAYKCIEFVCNQPAGGSGINTIVQILNDAMMPASMDGALSGPVNGNKISDDALNFFKSSDAAQIDASTAEEFFKCILGTTEKVIYAFKRGSDTTLLTNKRMFFVDKQGLISKSYAFISILWRNVKAFSVETGSTFDKDAEFRLFTNLPASSEFKQEMKKNVNILEIQTFLTDMICGTKNLPMITDSMPPPAVKEKKKEGFWNKLTGNVGMLMNQVEADEYFHSEKCNLLQPDEKVELAYKAKKDFFVFTTKRFIQIDHKSGFLGMNAKDEYISYPYSSILGWSVQSASGWFDKDSEMYIWTNMPLDVNGDEEKEGLNPVDAYGLSREELIKAEAKAAVSNAGKPAKYKSFMIAPGKSYLEFDFKKDQIDLILLNNLLSQKVLGARNDSGMLEIPEGTGERLSFVEEAGKNEDSKSSWDAMISLASGDARPVDKNEVQQSLGKWLCPGENVELAFKCGRDLSLFTNLRYLRVDVQGMSGKKIEYKSITYDAFCGFGVEAGGWMGNVEIHLYPKNVWEPYIEVDLRKGKVDTLQIQQFLSQKILNRAGNLNNGVPTDELPKCDGDEGVMTSIWDAFTDDGKAMNKDKANEILHTNPKLLLSDEKVELAFKCGVDMFVLTNKRCLIVDKNRKSSLTQYRSVPGDSMLAVKLQAPSGMFDTDSEVIIYSDGPDFENYPQPNDHGRFVPKEAMGRIEQDLRKGCSVSMWDMNKVLQGKVCSRKTWHDPEFGEVAQQVQRASVHEEKIASIRLSQVNDEGTLDKCEDEVGETTAENVDIQVAEADDDKNANEVGGVDIQVAEGEKFANEAGETTAEGEPEPVTVQA